MTMLDDRTTAETTWPTAYPQGYPVVDVATTGLAPDDRIISPGVYRG
ncbi:DEDDh family exonuclease, partial [Streptomyces yangpuensis]